MHTVMVIAGGFLLLGLFLLAARFTGGGGAAATAVAAKLFIPVWLAASIINMMVGVLRAGYSVMAEAPILLVVFGVPAVVAALVWRSARSA